MKACLLPVSLRVALAFAAIAFVPVSPAANQLGEQPSAFLRQHATSPVNWMPWGEAALTRAKQEQKPIFVAVGLFTSELSRAMSRQTFSNADTAAMLNENFVCVLIDGKEFRDITQLNQNYIGAAKQLTGLPMNLFLTPEAQPFEGANYLPPTEEWGKEGFNTVSKRALGAWKADAAVQRTKASEAVATVSAAQRAPAPGEVDAKAGVTLLKDAADAWNARADATNGGFGDPPKYVEPELLRFLLRDPATRSLALETLRAVAGSAVRDPLDGGFFRYTMDAEWRLPYFQKNLVDQPRIALAYLEAAKLSDDPAFAEIARDALRYATEQSGAGTKDASAAEDATGETLISSYLWSMDEIKQVLGADRGAEFAAAHGATAEGNLAADAFPNITTAGKNLLRRVAPRQDAAGEKSLADAAAKLLTQRKQRPAPVRDNAAPAGTHGWLLAALAQGGAQLKDASLIAAAKTEFELIRTDFIGKDGTLRRLPLSAAIATADDYAAVISGLLAYAGATKDSSAAALVAPLTKTLTSKFWDPDSGRFFATGPENTEAGIWARVHFVPPGAGEPPSPESMLLLVLAEQTAGDATVGEIKGKLARSIAAEIKESAEVARGDLLLAFQAFQATR